MKQKEQNSLHPLKHLQADFPASIVVFLVALPLCLGIALASGAPLFSGIIAGVIGGIVVGALSGSNLGVSGPAAGLTAIVLGAIQGLPTFQTFLMAVVLAGVIQIVLGLVKGGAIGHYIPTSVIKGMLAAIGVILILKQIPHAFGYDMDPEGDMRFEYAEGHNTFSDLLQMLDFISPGALTISAICLAIMILWERPFFKSKKIFQLVQGPLVVVVTGIGLNQLFAAYFPELAISTEHLVKLPNADGLDETLALFTHPDFSQIMNFDVIKVAVTLAIVASLETLLSVEATDKLDPYKRKTPRNRELIAQGFGNMAAGLIGGLPVTQVIVRSSANVNSGGRTKSSAVMHGIFLMGFVLLIPGLLNLIPLASLAAILLVIGYKLAKVSLFKEMFHKGMDQFVPFVVTIGSILVTDLLTGILIGLGVVVLFTVINTLRKGAKLVENHKRPYRLEKEEKNGAVTYRIVLSESVTFLSKAKIMKALQEIPEGSQIIIDASKTHTLDHDVQEYLVTFGNQEARQKSTDIVGMNMKASA